MPYRFPRLHASVARKLKGLFLLNFAVLSYIARLGSILYNPL
jgi:hypothetical protein